jgi:NACHT domain/Restriction endonuclease
MAPSIRILESDPNKRGDLFGRLMAALFLALGYDKARLNIHKSGREIDVEAQHRTEARRVIAECKATSTPIGGDDVNKFVGSLDAEKRKRKHVQTEGYFISLSGFTETAVEQEKDLGDRRVVLLDSNRVVEELASGRIVVPEKNALELAGRCVPSRLHALKLSRQTELLAHEVGWIWVSYFSQYQETTHFALVHADGNFISSDLATAVIASDKAVGGGLHRLSYLAPPADLMKEANINEAQDKYFSYLARECGEVQLEGLPADQEVGSRRLRLESLFVPLHLVKSRPPSQEPSNATQSDAGGGDVERMTKRKRHKRAGSGRAPAKEQQEERASIGLVLSRCSRMAILGLPGGGKSTLLKRLATAYAFPTRRDLAGDTLPDRNWLPLFVRCRQLGALVKSPVTAILHDIASRAEMAPELVRSFDVLVSRKLRDGAVLLLVDGLDEISDEGDRICFVRQLRTFLATYPNVALVVTSREAGFRIIGGTLSAQCEHFRLADFDDDDIKKLTLNWHKEVVGDTAQVKTDAAKLANTICSNYRLKNLASNPLLLTTLLLVKRWVGQLPTRRTVLYGKAIEVLLMTWNVEGHQPLDPDEIIPQLEYLAFEMMRAGIQTISSRHLAEILSSARIEMPEILGYARISVPEFIRRVELRSSLLMLSGHVIEDGVLHATYEFRHLTFQEYLVAGASVNGHYSGRKEGDNLLTLLRPFLQDERWGEIVPLAAVLSGRQVQPLISALIQICDESGSAPPWGRGSDTGGKNPAGLLAACLADEIQASPELLKEAVRRVIHLDEGHGLTTPIGSAKYGDMLYDEVIAELQNTERDLIRIEGCLFRMFPTQFGWDWDMPPTDSLFGTIDGNLMSPDPLDRTKGCLAAMELAFMTHMSAEGRSAPPWQPLFKVDEDRLQGWRDRILPLRRSEQRHLSCAALWATVWLSQVLPWGPQEVADMLPELIETWRASDSLDLQYLSSWMISEIPLVDRSKVTRGGVIPELGGFLERKRSEPRHRYEWFAAVLSGYFFGLPWSDEQLAHFVEQRADFRPGDEWKQNFLKLLGREQTDDSATSTSA